jgi:hypothetical protein
LAITVRQQIRLGRAFFERSGERAGLVRDPLHHAAVAYEDVGVVLDDVEARAVEPRREQLLGERHADGVGKTLPERACGRLHARRNAVLGMPGRSRAEAAEALQLLERQS